MNLKFTDYLDDDTPVQITVINYTPARHSPICSNPSSPFYSDCGDDAEFDTYVVKNLLTGKELRDSEMSQSEMDRFCDTIFEENFI